MRSFACKGWKYFTGNQCNQLHQALVDEDSNILVDLKHSPPHHAAHLRSVIIEGNNTDCPREAIEPLSTLRKLSQQSCQARLTLGLQQYLPFHKEAIQSSVHASRPSLLSMSSTHLFRLAGRRQCSKILRSARPLRRFPELSGASSGWATCGGFSTSSRRSADKDGQEAADHHEESFEEFTAR